MLGNAQQIVTAAPQPLKEYMDIIRETPEFEQVRELQSQIDLTTIWYPVGSALYAIQSQMNHSCTPNCTFTTNRSPNHRASVIASRL